MADVVADIDLDSVIDRLLEGELALHSSRRNRVAVSIWTWSFDGHLLRTHGVGRL
jgi:hypothetical protein